MIYLINGETQNDTKTPSQVCALLLYPNLHPWLALSILFPAAPVSSSGQGEWTRRRANSGIVFSSHLTSYFLVFVISTYHRPSFLYRSYAGLTIYQDLLGLSRIRNNSWKSCEWIYSPPPHPPNSKPLFRNSIEVDQRWGDHNNHNTFKYSHSIHNQKGEFFQFQKYSISCLLRLFLGANTIFVGALYWAAQHQIFPIFLLSQYTQCNIFSRIYILGISIDDDSENESFRWQWGSGLVA